MRKILITVGLFLLALGAAAYFERAAIRDFLYEAQQPALPAAVEHEAFVEDEATAPVADTTPGVAVNDGEEPAEDEEATPDVPVAAADDVVPTPNEPDEETAPAEEEAELIPSESVVNPSALPAEMNLAVPFTSQAPNSNWDLPYQEACEEASVYMVHEFYEGAPAGKIDPAVADADLLAIVEYENTLFGDYKDSTAEQIATLVMQMYGYSRVDVIEDPTIDEIKTHVAAGRPVIVPSAGRELGNPNFTSPGPLYHMLVVKGYTATQFITNDPGTRRGADYVYAFDTIMDAMHDWNGGDVANGAHVIIVIWPEN